MCQVLTEKPVLKTLCRSDCGCTYPIGIPIDDEIRRLEEHTKILQDRIENINTKITALKHVNNP